MLLENKHFFYFLLFLLTLLLKIVKINCCRPSLKLYQAGLVNFLIERSNVNPFLSNIFLRFPPPPALRRQRFFFVSGGFGHCGWIQDRKAFFHLSYTVLRENSGIFSLRVLPSRTLSHTPDF